MIGRQPLPIDRRGILRATAGAIGVGIVSGTAASSRHDIVVSFGDETAEAGQQAETSFDIDPANNSPELSSYDVEITYDQSVLNFVEATGEDMSDPVVTELSDGTISMVTVDVNGSGVPLTAATLTFEVVTDASDGDMATISLDDAEADFTDTNASPLKFVSESGSITVSGGSSFEIRVTGTNAPVSEGETLTVETLVENVDSAEDTQLIELLDFSGNSVDSEQVTLQGGEETSLSLDWETALGDAGEDEINITGAADTVTSTVEVLNTSRNPLLKDDFESYTVGSFPDGWSRSGNPDQQIVDSPGDSGGQALEMVGEYGGCEQALSHYELAAGIPSDLPIIFRGHIRPTGTGNPGCHGNKNGAIGLRDSPDKASNVANQRELVEFRTDGTVSGSGLDLGACQVGEYNRFDITYYLDSSAETVDLSYTINDSHRGNTTLDATEDESGELVESDLVYLTFASGDFTLFVDNLVTFSPVRYASANGTIDRTGLIDAVNDWRAERIDDSLLLDVIDAWRSGDPVV